MTEDRPQDRPEPPRDGRTRADVAAVAGQQVTEQQVTEQQSTDEPATGEHCEPGTVDRSAPGPTDDGPSPTDLVEHVVPRGVVRDVDPEDWSRSGGSDDERYLRERPPHW